MNGVYPWDFIRYNIINHRQDKKETKYFVLPPFLIILYFNLGEGADYLYHGKTQFVGVYTNDLLQMSPKELNALGVHNSLNIFPEYYLIRVNEFNKVARTPLEEWISYLKDGRINDDTTAPGLAEAKEKLQYMKMSDEERWAYEHEIMNKVVLQSQIDDAREGGLAEGLAEGRAKGLAEGRAKGLAEGRAKGLEEGLEEGRAKGLEEGRAEGREEGREEEKRLIAKSLRAAGVPTELIVQSTGLTPDEIAKL